MPSSTALVLSARRGQHGQRPTSTGSTAAARKCLLITCKIIIPPPDSRDPPDGPLYFTEKTFPPDYWDPPATSSHARKCLHITGKKNDSPPDCWDPPATSSHTRKCLTVGTHLVEAYVALSFWSRTCTYIRSVCLQAAAMNHGRARKGTTWSRGRRGSGSPRGEEYEGSLVRLRCEVVVAAGPGQRWEL